MPGRFSILSPFSGGRFALKITLYYLVLGCFWALLADPLLGDFLPDPSAVEFFRPYRDLLFFILTGLLIYLTLEHYSTTRNRAERNLQQALHVDARTGLPNLRCFQEQLAIQIARHAASGHQFAILNVDLDRFRVVSRTLGYPISNAIVVTLAERLRHSTGPQDLLARASGDEFFLLLPNIAGSGPVAQTARDLVRELRQPYLQEDHRLHLTASIGIAVYPHDGTDGDLLLKHAEVARSRTKEAGGDHYQFYFPEMDSSLLSSLTMENRLRQAIENNELCLRYQPQWNLQSGEMQGMEALLSWNHPDMPAISPETFIPLAEETGLIQPIGGWVLKEACLQHRRWREEGDEPGKIAVNVSSRQFHQLDFVALVRDVLRETGMDPAKLALEITETILMRDVEQNRITLVGLKALGLQIVIDDFGTGHSALSYLRSFPIDVLKIDKSFILPTPEDPKASALVAGIVAMAKSLNLEVVAEGVERQEQVRFLARCGCDRIQGFYYHPPLAAEAIPPLLKRWSGEKGQICYKI